MSLLLSTPRSTFPRIAPRRISAITKYCFVLLALFQVGATVLAQDIGGTITGIIHDATGANLSAAKITLTNTDTKEEQATVSDKDGAYRLPALRPGHYQMRVEAPGFATTTANDITLNVAQHLVFDESLKVGEVGEEVNVESGGIQVATTDASVGEVVDEQRMAELPLNGRNYTDLTMLTPGVQQQVKPTGGGTGASGTWFSANGIPARSNMFYIDGTVMNNAFWTGPNSEGGTTLGVDGIKEFKTVTSTFGPEYAYTAGSQMVIVSKGGSNRWGGSVFEYIRNNHLDARNYFEAAPSFLNGQRTPQYKRNNFGASFGGPIQKDKTFAFLVYEGLRSAQGDTIQTTTLPAACHQLVASPGATAYTLDVGVQNAIFPDGAYLANPTACNSGLNRNSKVPAVVQPWIGQFPLPNEGPTILNGNGYTFPASTNIRDDYAQLRVDRKLGVSDDSFARYTFDDTHVTDPYAQLNTSDNGAAYPQFSVVGRSRNQWLTLSETHTFSPTMVGTTHLSFSRTVFVADNVYNTTSLNPFGNLNGPQWSYIPGFTGTYSPGNGTTGLGPATTYLTYHYQNILSISHDLYYTKGKHNMKFGFLLSNFQNPLLQLRGAYGSVTFSGISAFMQGLMTGYNGVTSGIDTAATDPTYLKRMFNWHTAGFYAGDEWHALPRLTFNYGVRYEFMANFHEHQGRSSYLPDMATSTTYKVGPNVDNPTFRNFAPRLGLAWDVLGNGSLAVRSGFGVYYDISNIGGLLTQSPQGVPPFSYSTTFTTTTPVPVTLPMTTFFNSSQVGKSLQMNDYNVSSPTYYQYNLAIEKKLPFNSTLSVAYVGMHGSHMYNVQEGNPVVPAGYGNDGRPYWNTTTGAAGCANNALTLGVTSTFTPNAYPCRINPYWTAVIFINTHSSASYNSLQITENTRIGKSLNISGNYTWARDLDYTAGQMNGTECGANGMPIGDYATDLKFEKGPSCSDIANTAHISMLYHLPNTSKHFLGGITNGWWVSSIASLQGGMPFSVTGVTQRSYDGDYTAAERVDVSTGGAGTGSAAGKTFVPFDHKKVITHDPKQWFNPYMFQLQPLGHIGNSSRGILRGPGLIEWDASVVKDTRVAALGDGGMVQFRAEFFNLPNHTNFGSPNGTAFTGAASNATAFAEAPQGTAGQITTTATSSRQIQFAVRVMFGH